MRSAVVIAWLAGASGCHLVFSLDEATNVSQDANDGDAEGTTEGFSSPMVIPELYSAAQETGPSLTEDQLEIVFSSTRVGSLNADLWFSTRPTLGMSFSGAAVNPPELGSDAEETDPFLTKDGLQLYFSSNRGGTKDIYRSTRQSRTTPWSAPVLVPELNSESSDRGVSISDDGQVLVFSSNRDGTLDIFLSVKGVDDTWGPPVAIPALSTGADEQGPSIVDGGNTIYFARNRDIYVSTRSNGEFASASRVNDVTTEEDESDPWLSEDQRVIYFAREDRSGVPNHNLLSASR